MNNEEKILAILEKHGEMLERQGKVLERHEEILERMDKRLESLEDRQSKLEADVSSIKVRLDVDIQKQLDLLAEGQQTLLETLAPKSRVEVLEDDVVFLKSVIKALAQRVSELEKVQ